MLPDTRIISRHGDFAVLAERQAVTFRDLSIVSLHRVQRGGVNHTYLRALCLDNTHWCAFDLRLIHSSFAEDFPALLARDHQGLVLYTLRAAYSGSAEFIAKAFREFEHVWTTAVEAQAFIVECDRPSERVMFQPELRRVA